MKIDWSKLFMYINKRADGKTVEEVECWREEDSRNEDFFNRANDYYRNDPTRNESFTEEQLDVLYARMRNARRVGRQRLLWQRVGVVAACTILLVSVGTWWYYGAETYPESGTRVARVDRHMPEVIVVTESGDQLTMGQLSANMVKKVSDHKLEYSMADSIVAEKDTARAEKKVHMHTIIVPRGRTFELVLSDGTFVLLSPSSELTYPVQFDSCSVREVTLRGEAYFEVKKSSNRFAVNTGRMKLQVYGTTFNVLTRDGAPDEAVLIEGKVGILPNSLADAEETILRPGNKSTVDEAGRVMVALADLAEYTAKRNGFILFNGKTIEQIVRSLELYYDVDFVMDNSVLGSQQYVFSIKRDATLREILDVIETVADVKFIIDRREVKIVGK